METNYHARREREQNILSENAAEKGVAAIHANLARLHHEAAGADPDILVTTDLSGSDKPAITFRDAARTSD